MSLFCVPQSQNDLARNNDYNKAMLQAQRINVSSNYILGINITAEEIILAYGNQSGIISERSSFKPEANLSFQSFIGLVSQHSDKLLNIARAQHLPLPERVSVSIAGNYDPQLGILISSRDFPAWKNEPLKSQLQLLFNLPVYIEKSATAGAQAESLFGVAQDLRDFMFIDLGHNLSMAFSAHGRIFSSLNPHAGAIGRVRFCQDMGASNEYTPTLSELCGSAGIVQQALTSQVSHWDPDVSIYQIINAARNADPYAIEILSKAGTNLGHHLAPYIHLLRQEAIILGFPGALAGEIFSEPVFKAAQDSTGLGLDEMPKIIPSALGNRLPDLQALAPAIYATRSQGKLSQ
jgi:predicted NBD/HSP70 family sugar kinase